MNKVSDKDNMSAKLFADEFVIEQESRDIYYNPETEVDERSSSSILRK